MSTYRSEAPSGVASASAKRSHGARRAWTITGFLVFLYMINSADKAVLGLIAQPLAEELDLGAAQIGLVGSLFYIPFIIGGLLAGTVTRLVALEWALAMLAVVWALTMLPMVVAAGFGMLLVTRLLLGLSEGPSAPLIYAATYSWHEPNRRGLPGALVAGAPALSAVVIVPVVSYLVAAHGWRSALIALAALGLLWSALWLPVWSPGPFIASRGEDEGAAAVAQTERERVPWKRVFVNRTFLTLAPLAASVGALVAVVMTWFPSYLELGLGYSRLQAGSMLAFPSLAGLIFMLSVSAFSDRLTSRGVNPRVTRVIIPCVGTALSGLLLVSLPAVGAPALAVLVLSLAFGFLSIGLPLFIAAVSEVCPPRQIAGMLGVFTATYGIGGLIGPFATGVIVDGAAGPGAGYATAFQVFGMLAVVLGVVALVLADPERDRRRMYAADDVAPVGRS